MSYNIIPNYCAKVLSKIIINISTVQNRKKLTTLIFSKEQIPLDLTSIAKMYKINTVFKILEIIILREIKEKC